MMSDTAIVTTMAIETIALRSSLVIRNPPSAAES